MSDYISVDDTEFELFELEEEAAFPDFGMTCKVPNCSVMTHFFKYGQYIDHFVKFHRPTINVFKCTDCRKLFGNRKNAKKHLLTHTPKATLLVEKRPNGNFVDPKSVKLPKPPAKGPRVQISSSQAKEIRRMEQSYKRRLYRFQKEKDFAESESVARQIDSMEGRS